MRSDKEAKAEKAIRQPSAARLARAEAEDRMDAEWLEQCLRVLSKLVEESGLPWFEALLASKDSPFPPRPAGFKRRQEYCNRCGQRTSMSDEYDALYCGRCNRWIESKCNQAGCVFCRCRSARPLPENGGR